MREMKDSGIEWIGKIPKDWDVIKIGQLFSIRNERNYLTEDKVQLLSLYTGIGVFPQGEHTTASGNHAKTVEGYKIVKKNDIVVNIILAWMGAIGVSNYDGVTSPAYDVYSPNLCKVIPHYFHYVFRTSGIAGECYKYGRGIMMMRWRTYSQEFKQIKVPFPNIEQQRIIAGYLDLKCNEIEELISDVRSEIDILEGYKCSVIAEKVTKGLNPDVTMKDSSIGWMPKIPSHWKVSKLKYHLKRQTIKNHDDATVLSLYREYGVIPKDSRKDNHNVTSEDTSKYLYVKKGDFVINKMKAWQGSVAVSNYNGIVSPAYYVYEFSDKSIYKDYFHYLMRNKMYAIEFRRLSGGIREGQWDLSAVSLENILILIPPYNEQVAIAEYLNKTTKEIEEIINRKKEQLTVLDEYKKAIIYEYVTGKRQVRA